MAAVDRFLVVAVGHCLMAAVGVFLPYVVDSLPRTTARSFSCIGRSGVAGPTDDSSILPCDTTVYHLHGITSSDDGQPVYRVKRKQHRPHVIRSTHQARHTHAAHPPTHKTHNGRIPTSSATNHHRKPHNTEMPRHPLDAGVIGPDRPNPAKHGAAAPRLRRRTGEQCRAKRTKSPIHSVKWTFRRA